jgi:hypothetical protein
LNISDIIKTLNVDGKSGVEYDFEEMVEKFKRIPSLGQSDAEYIVKSLFRGRDFIEY